jgi:hypothetical protein
MSWEIRKIGDVKKGAAGFGRSAGREDGSPQKYSLVQPSGDAGESFKREERFKHATLISLKEVKAAERAAGIQARSWLRKPNRSLMQASISTSVS